jgi:hypothetical protein
MATVRGEGGRIVWAYFDAARVADYEVAPMPDKRTWLLAARVVDQPNAYNLAEGRKRNALVFVASHNVDAMRWPILAETLTITDGRLTARLGTGPL